MRLAALAVGIALVVATWLAPSPAEGSELLPNGLRAWSYESDDPATFSIAVLALTGARDETDHERGISHALEHAIFLGTRELDQGALLAEFRRRGVEFNGRTSADLTTYFFDAPVDEAEWLIGVTGAMMATPALEEEAVAAEILVVLEELDGRGADLLPSGPDAPLYPGHGLGTNPGGTSRSVAGLDAGDLAEWHRRRYRAGDMVVAWAASVSAERQAALAAAVRAAYGALPSGRADGERAAPRPRTGTWMDPDLSGPGAGSSGHAGLLMAGHHVEDASPETMAALLVAERVLEDECFRAMRTDHPLAYFTNVRFVAHSDARRLEFTGRVKDAKKLSGLLDALAVARARAARVDEPTFQVARAAALAAVAMPSDGPSLEKVARQELMLARSEEAAPRLGDEAAPRLGDALAGLTRDRMASVLATQLTEPNAYVVSNVLLLGPLSPAVKKGLIVAAIVVAALLLARLFRTHARRLRLRLVDAMTRVRIAVAGRKEQDDVVAEIEEFLRKGPRPGRDRGARDHEDGDDERH